MQQIIKRWNIEQIGVSNGVATSILIGVRAWQLHCVIVGNVVCIGAEQLIGSGPFSGASGAGTTSLFGRQLVVLT
jgi:hypothetical protein